MKLIILLAAVGFLAGGLTGVAFAVIFGFVLLALIEFTCAFLDNL